jgi:hypothetical protein
MSPCTLHDVINAMDEAIATIQRLAELRPVLDEGGYTYFPNAIELLSLICQQAGHLDKLSASLARCVLPRPYAVEGQR